MQGPKEKSLPPKAACEGSKVSTTAPSYNDVVLGRGKGISNHSGNVQFREIVWFLKDKYIQAHKNHKIDVAKEVVARIGQLDPPGRFLVIVGEHSDKDHYYVEAGAAKVIEKTCQALREKKNTAPESAILKALEEEEKKKKLARRTKEQRRSTSMKIRKASTSVNEKCTKPAKKAKTSARCAAVKSTETDPSSFKPSIQATMVQMAKDSLRTKIRIGKRNKAKTCTATRTLEEKTPAVDHPHSDGTLTPTVEVSNQVALSPTKDRASSFCCFRSRENESDDGARLISRCSEMCLLDKDSDNKVDGILSVLPPQLTAFFSGLYSGTLDRQLGMKAPTMTALWESLGDDDHSKDDDDDEDNEDNNGNSSFNNKAVLDDGHYAHVVAASPYDSVQLDLEEQPVANSPGTAFGRQVVMGEQLDDVNVQVGEYDEERIPAQEDEAQPEVFAFEELPHAQSIIDYASQQAFFLSQAFGGDDSIAGLNPPDSEHDFDFNDEDEDGEDFDPWADPFFPPYML